MFVIEIRQIAESDLGLVSKGGKPIQFDCIEKARTFGKKNIEDSKFIASWEAITVETAKNKGHNV